jgi:hypothetical protein
VTAREPQRSWAIATAAWLGLVAVGAGVASLVAGGAVPATPAGLPPWLGRYAALRPLVHGEPRIGYWGNRSGFFRAQYVLAPTVLSWENASPAWRGRGSDAPPPTLVIVDVRTAHAREAGIRWLRQDAERRGHTAAVRSAASGLVLVELGPGAGAR